ncbi:hypothetical protein SCLCIDRAFT_1209824 [Scleroderma citrinum Foug A]|uniref:Uncharacterized protein n=1 Tax=Scleroderma citrinum Foug A TaxID=1036808 RepID=A0A0C3EII1_9AGAM|nr:hypothetical protein SCLCIDRAFT_1209824 [Scleroderma citrinum Foug A]
MACVLRILTGTANTALIGFLGEYFIYRRLSAYSECRMAGRKEGWWVTVRTTLDRYFFEADIVDSLDWTTLSSELAMSSTNDPL